ncbi:unnamed protein product [Urochloa humidicola]
MEREVNTCAGADAPRPPPRPPPPSPPVTGRSKVENPRDRVSFTSRPRPSCWGRIRIHRIGRSRSRAGSSGEGRDTGPATPVMRRTTTISSRLCGVGGDRGPGGCGGKADAASAAGARSLLQRNDFYSDDCNTHRSGCIP